MRTLRPPCLAATAAAALIAANACAQAPQRVEIVGTTPLPGAGRLADNVPGRVQTATAEDIAQSQALDLAEHLARRFGSVNVNEIQGNPLQPDLSFRGFTASPLLGTPQGIAVTIDGVRMNQPFGDVVSWDLIPRRALAQATLLSGAQPLFGLNAQGGALVLTTLDGRSAPGGELSLQAGSNGRRVFGFAIGRVVGDLDVFASGQRFDECGWRDFSPSRQSQLFVKFGSGSAAQRVSFSVAAADTRLNGNGPQEQRWLDARWASVFSQPDETANRSLLLNLSGEKALSPDWRISGNLFARRIRTRTFNGDVNGDALDQNLYFNPTPANLDKLAAAGYTGMPAVRETPASAAFPYWNCLLNAVDNDEPNEKCSGLLNRTSTDQSSWGFGLQAAYAGKVAGASHAFAAGVSIERARSDFSQTSEFGTLQPDHGVIGVGRYADGTQNSENALDGRVDLSTRMRTESVYLADTIQFSPMFSATAGLRWNRNLIELRDRLEPGGGAGSLDGTHVYSRWAPTVGVVATLAPGIVAHASAGESGRAPTAVELGCADPADPCRLPNAMASDPPLEQVVTRTFEAGLRGTRGPLRWHAGLFRADSRNDIVFVAAQVSGSGYFRNVARTRRQGLEFGVSGRAGSIELGADFTLLDATFQSTETLPGAANSSNTVAQGVPPMPGLEGGTIDVRPGDRLPLLPRQTLKLRADWRPRPGLLLGLDATLQSDQLARGNENGQHRPDGTIFLGSGRSAGFGVVNLTGAWDLGGGWTLSAKIANLFDRRYTTGALLAATPYNAAGGVDARQVGSYPVGGSREYAVRQTTLVAPGAPRQIQLGAVWRFD